MHEWEHKLAHSSSSNDAAVVLLKVFPSLACIVNGSDAPCSVRHIRMEKVTGMVAWPSQA